MAERIDGKIEESTRKLLGHALRAEADALEQVLERVTDEGDFIPVMTLVGRIATVVVIDLCDGHQPTAADLRRVAETTAEVIAEDYDKPGAELVHTYLALVVFDGEPFDTALGVENSVLVPLIATANLLASTSDFDNGETWCDYLDRVEATIEAASDPA